MAETMTPYITEITFTRNVKRDKLRNYLGKGNMVINRHQKPPIVFKGGQFKTSDRLQINDLLNSEELRRGEIVINTPMELVETYLAGDEPDRLTEEVLLKVSPEGLRLMAESIGLPRNHGGHGNVIRRMIVNTPITNELYHIMQGHPHESEEKVDLLDQLQKEGHVYKSGAWYKLMKGSEEDKEKDLSMGKGEAAAYRWIEDNKGILDKVIENKSK